MQLNVVLRRDDMTFVIYFIWLLIGVEMLRTLQAILYQVVNKVVCNPFNWSFWIAAIAAVILLGLQQ